MESQWTARTGLSISEVLQECSNGPTFSDYEPYADLCTSPSSHYHAQLHQARSFSQWQLECWGTSPSQRATQSHTCQRIEMQQCLRVFQISGCRVRF